MTVITSDLLEALEEGFQTLQQLGDRFGVTRERIRQICKERGISRGDYATEHWEELSVSSMHRHAPRSRWPRIHMPQFKAANGFCMKTGCNALSAYNRSHCQKHLNEMKVRAREQQYGAKTYHWRKERGLCPYCSGVGEPVVPGGASCQKHREYFARYSKERTARRKLGEKVRQKIGGFAKIDPSEIPKHRSTGRTRRPYSPEAIAALELAVGEAIKFDCRWEHTISKRGTPRLTRGCGVAGIMFMLGKNNNRKFRTRCHEGTSYVERIA